MWCKFQHRDIFQNAQDAKNLKYVIYLQRLCLRYEVFIMVFTRMFALRFI